MSVNEFEVNCFFFAKAKEITKLSQTSIHLPPGSTTKTLLNKLLSEFPGLLEVLNNCLLALNQEYVSLDEEISLTQGDEVALIPPISGG
jgi:molybdopterin converting factor subunit 1